ncbi:MAG: tRNA (guanine-N7)-methyltransferase [Planctomycetota bacterium]
MSKGISKTQTMDTTGFGRDQADLPELADFGSPPGSNHLDLRTWFPGDVQLDADGKPRKLEIELGSGKGTFLAQEAPLHDDVLYLGIEWASAFYKYAADRMRRLNLRQVQMLRADGVLFLRHYVPDASVHAFHWYFPDPWPKARHHKRRTFQTPFLRGDLYRVLVPGGRIRVATDHLEYWAWMQEHAEQVKDLYDIEPFVSPASAKPGELVGTNFERKYRKEGRTFNGMVLVKK